MSLVETGLQRDTVYPDGETRIEERNYFSGTSGLRVAIRFRHAVGMAGEEESTDLTIQVKAAVLLSIKR